MEKEWCPGSMEHDPDDHKDPEKKAVECVCPKCGERHVLNFHWIGRGIPRKYCLSCKNNL